MSNNPGQSGDICHLLWCLVKPDIFKKPGIGINDAVNFHTRFVILWNPQPVIINLLKRTLPIWHQLV